MPAPVQVELWWIDLAGAAARERELRRLLPVDEITRADRYRVAAARVEFTTARGVLRAVLGRRLGRDPRELELALLDNGKPFLARHPQLGFSLSHSRSRAVIAIADHPCVGVDIEYLDRSVDTEPIAELFFPTRIRRELNTLPMRERVPAFYRQWVRTEAVAKADGSGLAYGIPDVGRNVLPAGVTRTVGRWAVVDLDAGPLYAAAVAAPITDCRVGVTTTKAGRAASAAEPVIDADLVMSWSPAPPSRDAMPLILQP